MANERRLIDADKILKFCEDGLNSKAFGHDAIEIMAEIQCAPTVEAVEVVRCKDCRYSTVPKSQKEYYAEKGILKCDKPGGIAFNRCVYGIDYCSYGERREKRKEAV